MEKLRLKMFLKSILIVLLISIVSANSNKQELTSRPNSKDVIKTLIGKITAIKRDLEKAIKNISGNHLLNKIEKLLLSLLTSMHKAIGHQHLLRDSLQKFIKQITHALTKLKDLQDDGGKVTEFVNKYIQPIIPSLKNLISNLNDLADSGIVFVHEGHHGGHHHEE